MNIFRQFANDAAASSAVVFAMGALPLIIAAGAAIDYGNLVYQTVRLQSALDSATIAAVKAAEEDREKIGTEYLSQNAQLHKYKIVSSKFVTKSTNEVESRAQAQVLTPFMSIVGIRDKSIIVQSGAVKPKGKLKAITFSIDSAKGAFDKEIYIFTKDKNGAIVREQNVLVYDYTFDGAVGNKDYSPPIGNSIRWELGEYETFGIKMVVYADESYYGKRINSIEYYSDSEDAADFTKSSGDCHTSEKQKWEDGGDSDYIDFVFNMTCEDDFVATGQVRLTR